MADRQVVLEEPLVCEAQVDVRLDQSGIESQNLLEFFRGTGERLLLQSLLAGVKGLLDLFFGCLTDRCRGEDEKQRNGRPDSRHFPSVPELARGRHECWPRSLNAAPLGAFF